MTAEGVVRRAPGQHRVRLVLPEPPSDKEKYSYIDRQLPYLSVLMVIGFVAATSSQIWFEVETGWWPFAFFTVASVMSFGLSLPLSFTGRGFDLAAHQKRVNGWRPGAYPDVDIFLPICSEPIEIVRNTWTGSSISLRHIRASHGHTSSMTAQTRRRRSWPVTSGLAILCDQTWVRTRRAVTCGMRSAGPQVSS